MTFEANQQLLEQFPELDPYSFMQSTINSDANTNVGQEMQKRDSGSTG